MIEKLENWVNNGWLDKHQPGCEEIADLLLVGSRDLKKSRTPNLGPPELRIHIGDRFGNCNAA